MITNEPSPWDFEGSAKNMERKWPMTPKERAEKIWEMLRDQVILFQNFGHEKSAKKGIEEITAQLDEACAEAVNKALEDARYKLKELDLLGRTKGYDQGFSAAREKAKEIALSSKPLPMDDGNDPCHCVTYTLCPETIADRIGKMEA